MNYTAFPFHFLSEGVEHTAYFDLDFLMDGPNPLVTNFELVGVPEGNPLSPSEIYSLFDEYLEAGGADEELREAARGWA